MADPVIPPPATVVIRDRSFRETVKVTCGAGEVEMACDLMRGFACVIMSPQTAMQLSDTLRMAALPWMTNESSSPPA